VRRPRVYVAHPMTSYGTPWEAKALAELARLLPRVELVDPAKRYLTDSGWLRSWPRLLRSLGGLVVLADESGTVGTGVLREIVDALAAGVPLAAFDPGRGLVELAGVELVDPGVRCRAVAAWLDYGETVDPSTWPRGPVR
jgi:hypothetical protein